MKIKKEVWIEVCDFCGEPKEYTCDICGKDLCSKHALTLTTHYTEYPSAIILGTPIVKTFCPEHLSDTLKEIYFEKLQQVNEKGKKKGDERNWE